jgi:uncharacterized protein (TIGR03083 family)
MTTTAVSDTVAPRSPGMERDTAMRLARAEYDRFAAQARQLAPSDWSRPTVCAGWDVHAMACHVLGMAELAASPIEAARQMRSAKRAGGLLVDGLTDLQYRKHLHRTPEDLATMLTAIGPRAARGRRRTPSLMRRRSMGEQPVDETGLLTETWTLGYLLDVILTRDTWMHRSDIAVATGRDMELSPIHDGVLVADVASEWATRHGQPCMLTLTGPAGGSWTYGGGGEVVELDAVEFCRVLSGRGKGDGLLATRVPF